MTARDYVRLIGLRAIGVGRDAAPVIERGLFQGFTARCRSSRRREWLFTAEHTTAAAALAELLAQCIAESATEPHEISRYCPLFDGQRRTIFEELT